MEATSVFMPRSEKGKACSKSDTQMPRQGCAERPLCGEPGPPGAGTEQNEALLTTAQTQMTAGLSLRRLTHPLE